MLHKPTLSRKRIINGKYEGLYENNTIAPVLDLFHMGKPIAECTVTALEEKDESWVIECDLPSEVICDGIQTFTICNREDQAVLDHFSIIAGEPLEHDLREEINLLREELDMLKRAFRRHCVEMME